MPCRRTVWRHRVAGAFLVPLAALLAAALPVGDLAAFEVGEEFEIGHWAGHAQYGGDGSGFSLCLVSAEFDNGVTLAFVRKDSGLAFFLDDPRWQLGQYDRYPLTVSVDRLWSQRVEGRAVLHAVFVELGQDLRAWDALRRGHRLSVVTEAQRFSFVLDGSARALDRLEQCFRDHSGASLRAERDPFSGNANPFAATPAPAKPPARTETHGNPPAATRGGPSMQRQQLRALLEKVIGVEFWVKPAAEMDPNLTIDYVYGIGDLLTGFYWEEFADGRSADGVLSDALADLQSSCSGPYISGLRESVDSARALRSHGSHACKADDLFADAAVIAWKNGYVSVFLVMTDMADAEIAEEVSTALGVALAP